jgi:hypothetical protein
MGQLPADFSKYKEGVLRFALRFLGESKNSLQSVISTQCEKSFLMGVGCAAEQNETAFFAVADHSVFHIRAAWLSCLVPVRIGWTFVRCTEASLGVFDEYQFS